MKYRIPSCGAVLAAGLILWASHGDSQAATAPASAQPGSVQIEQIVHDYILTHPEVVLESVRAFDERTKAARQEQQRKNVASHLTELQSDSPVTESADKTAGPVTLVEFFDYRCGYCRKVQPAIAELTHAPGVRIVYKDLPILGPDSQLAAQAALAAEKQGAYGKFHDALLAAPPNFTQDSIEKLAAEAGLDVARLKKDMASTEVNASLARNRELAAKLGIQATPTFVVGQNLVSGALTPDALKSLIEGVRQQNVATPKDSNPGGL